MQWIASGSLDAEAVAALDQVSFAIADLSGLTLGQTVGDTVLIDIDAAGHGWFVDLTASDDSEFGLQPDPGKLVAEETSPAFGRMDLLTVVMHELGHVVGFDHMDIEGIMGETLETGTRYIFNQETTRRIPSMHDHSNNGQGNEDGSQNDAAAAEDDSATTIADTSVTIAVVSNDDLGNGNTVIHELTQGKHGTWDVNTPYENALELVSFFKNGKLITVHGGSRGVQRSVRGVGQLSPSPDNHLAGSSTERVGAN